MITFYSRSQALADCVVKALRILFPGQRMLHVPYDELFGVTRRLQGAVAGVVDDAIRSGDTFVHRDCKFAWLKPPPFETLRTDMALFDDTYIARIAARLARVV